jgi:hypothetical protein
MLKDEWGEMKKEIQQELTRKQKIQEFFSFFSVSSVLSCSVS